MDTNKKIIEKAVRDYLKEMKNEEKKNEENKKQKLKEKIKNSKNTFIPNINELERQLSHLKYDAYMWIDKWDEKYDYDIQHYIYDNLSQEIVDFINDKIKLDIIEPIIKQVKDSGKYTEDKDVKKSRRK